MIRRPLDLRRPFRELAADSRTAFDQSRAPLQMMRQAIASALQHGGVSREPRGVSRPNADRRRDGRPKTQDRGIPDAGRVVRLFVGAGHGVIRVANGSEVFFHRTDMRHGSSINDLAIGDPVAFERLDDHVSGARALRVTKNDGRTQASERSS